MKQKGNCFFGPLKDKRNEAIWNEKVLRGKGVLKRWEDSLYGIAYRTGELVATPYKNRFTR